jgi:spore coat protein U-like protein
MLEWTGAGSRLVRRSVLVGIASAAYSNVWGDGSGSTTLVGGGALLSVGTTVTPYTVYGRIPAGQDSAAGSFMDTIVVTLNY